MTPGKDAMHVTLILQICVLSSMTLIAIGLVWRRLSTEAFGLD